MHANKNDLVVYHSGSSALNPLTWGFFIDTCGKYFTGIPFEQQFKLPRTHFVPSKRSYEFWFFLNSAIPQKLYSSLARVTFSTKMKKNADRLKRINQKGKMINYMMSHFTLNDWVFDAKLYYHYQKTLSEEELQDFYLDIPNINWKHYTYLFCYGIQTFVMNQKGVSIPQENFDDVMARQPSITYFDDILWSYNRGKISKTRQQSEVIGMIMNAPNVVKSMIEFVEYNSTQKKYQGYNDSELMGLAEARVKEYASELSANLKKSMIKSFAWVSHKIFKKTFDKLIVDVSYLKMLK